MNSGEIPKEVLLKKKQFIAKLSSVTNYRNDSRKYSVAKWSLGRLLRDGGESGGWEENPKTAEKSEERAGATTVLEIVLLWKGESSGYRQRPGVS